MNRNIGNIERVIRVIAGLGITSMAFLGPQNPWFFLGIIPLATGLVGWCPPYYLLGFSTAKSCGSCTNNTSVTK